MNMTNHDVAESSALRRHKAVAPRLDRDGAPAAQREKRSENARVFERKVGFRKETVAPVLERKPTEDINQSAEAFINKFRKQLLLQRLESIENYEEMIRRGAAP